MKMIVLYGPPGVGKYTVGKEVSERTGAVLFHNHLMIDLVESIITRAWEGFTPAIYNLQRQVLFDAMAANQRDVIFTFAFSINEPEGVDLLRELHDHAATHQVDITFIYLHCDLDELAQRIASPSRQEFGKLTDTAALSSMAESYDLQSPVEAPDHISIETTNRSVEDVVLDVLRLLDQENA